LSKYNAFHAILKSSFASGPAYGVRLSSTVVVFQGTTLASGGGQVHSYIRMKTSSDKFNGWETGTYGSKWGSDVTGLSDIRGIY
jgi:hypothetical protein